jgi:hypothetical protein
VSSSPTWRPTTPSPIRKSSDSSSHASVGCAGKPPTCHRAFAFRSDNVYTSGGFQFRQQESAHHENLLQSCPGDRHFLSVLLFYNNCGEHHFCVRFRAADILTIASRTFRSPFGYCRVKSWTVWAEKRPRWPSCVHSTNSISVTNSGLATGRFSLKKSDILFNCKRAPC